MTQSRAELSAGRCDQKCVSQHFLRFLPIYRPALAELCSWLGEDMNPEVDAATLLPGYYSEGCKWLNQYKLVVPVSWVYYLYFHTNGGSGDMESSFMISSITAVSHIRFLKVRLNFTDFVQVQVFAGFFERRDTAN